MTIEVTNIDHEKAVGKFFAEELPAVGIRVERDIFSASEKLAWPMPPQPSREGKFLRWRDYASIVVWSDRAISMMIKVGGEARVREAVLSCRLQEQADRLVLDLSEILAEIENPSRSEGDASEEVTEGSDA